MPWWRSTCARKQAEEIHRGHRCTRQKTRQRSVALDILRTGLEIVPNWNFVGSGRIEPARLGSWEGLVTRPMKARLSAAAWFAFGGAGGGGYSQIHPSWYPRRRLGRRREDRSMHMASS